MAYTDHLIKAELMNYTTHPHFRGEQAQCLSKILAKVQALATFVLQARVLNLGALCLSDGCLRPITWEMEGVILGTVLGTQEAFG